MRAIIDRRAAFLERVSPEPNTGCWLWTLATDRDGYGVWSLRHRQHRAHRIAWEIYRGTVEPELLVLHRCDFPACCNPDHLFLGTEEDNRHDMERKGRRSAASGDRHYSRLHPELRPRGEGHGMAKLSEDQARLILARCRAGERQADVARSLGVSKQMVNVIATGKKWKHLRAA